MIIVDSVSLNIRAKDILQTLRIGSQRKKEAESIIEQGLKIICPKAIYTFAKVEAIKKPIVKLNLGQPFNSIILSKMLKIGQVIALFVVTIGEKLEHEAHVQAKTSILNSWILEQTGDFALQVFSAQVKAQIERALGGKVSSFNPGAGTGRLFSIDQQQVIFGILNPQSSIGVSLTSSCLMIPRKSVSGIYATTSQEYVACQYCPRQKCSNRKKPFKGETFSLNCET